MHIQVEEQQAALESKEFTATAGGGVVEVTVTELQDYWKDNQTVFKLDSVSFLKLRK